MANSDNDESISRSPSNNSNAHRPFPPIPPPFTLPTVFSPARPNSQAVLGHDFANMLQQHDLQHMQSHHDILRLHQQQHQAQLTRYGLPSLPLAPLPFLTMPPPGSAIGLGRNYNESVNSTMAGNGNHYSDGSYGERHQSATPRPVGPPRQIQVSEPLPRSPHSNLSGSADTSTSRSPRPTRLTGQTASRGTNEGQSPSLSLGSQAHRPTRPTVSVSRETHGGPSMFINQSLGQTPADPHGVRRARAANRPTNPSALGGSRMGPFLRERVEQRQAREQALATIRATGPSINSPTWLRRLREREGMPGTLPLGRPRPGTTPVSGAVPSSGPLFVLMRSALAECSDYAAVAEFAKSNYSHLSEKCFSKPRFLQQASAARPNLERPTPLTMQVVLARVIEYHIDTIEVTALFPPDWEGYMLFALELVWLGTGLMGGIGGDIVEQIWQEGADRSGSGDEGRYVESDVRLRLTELIWRRVESRFVGPRSGR